MHWLLAVVGAFFGAIVADSRELLGAVVGFLAVFVLFALSRLRREQAGLRQEVAQLRARLAASTGSAPPAGQVDAGSSSQAPSPTPPPRPSTAPPMSSPSGPAQPAPAYAPAQASTAAAAAVTAPAAPRGRDWQQALVARLRHWFTEGNVPVKIGVLVLLFGVAAALRFAAAQGYFTMSLQVRLAVIAASALFALGLGWRQRRLRPAFGLSLQGGAIGVLLLTVFAAYRLYALLPPTLAFVLVVVLVAGSALLALLQNNMALAVLGFLGGYLAPVLISTGSANHVALFSYYAVLNAAVLGISWQRNWRLLNLVGFVFTFGVGTAWGAEHYRPDMFASVEPFLVAFFVFYLAIGLLYVVRQTEHRRPWVDGTLVFGTPLVAFPLQAVMLKDDRLGLAFSALLVAAIYAALVYWLRQRRGEKLLTEAYGSLALGFATLAVPLAFSANTTASLWALEGAGVAWLGLRQQRKLPWVAGLALQWLAAGAYVMGSFDGPPGAGPGQLLLLNQAWLGAAMLSFAGFVLARIHDLHLPRYALPAMLFAWAVSWWLVAGVSQLDLARSSLGQWQFSILYLATSIGAVSLARHALGWPRLNGMLAICALLGLALVLAADDEFSSPLAGKALPGWAVYAAFAVYALWRGRDEDSPSLGAAHLLALATVALAATLHLDAVCDVQQFAQGWRFLAWVAPLALLTLGLWRRPALFAWPRAAQWPGNQKVWFAAALGLLSYALLVGMFAEGSAQPLPYVPLMNPLELSLLGLALLCLALADRFEALRPVRRAWPLLAFALVTLSTLRAVHHFLAVPWSASLLQSGFAQASLTVVWSLIGVGAWILGSRRGNRQIWTGGAVLMLVVLLKLLVVDREYMGNLPGIVSFIAVGLLLVVVGYFAPSPPKPAALGESA